MGLKLSKKISLVIWLIFLAGIASAQTPVFLSGPNYTDVTQSSAQIQWQTDIAANNNTLYYGLTTNLDYSIHESVASLDHTINIQNLIPNSIYHFLVITCVDFECAQSQMQQFTTLQIPSIPAPVINDASIQANATNDSATIAWNTDINSNSIIYYGLSQSQLSEAKIEDNSQSHSIIIPNLSPNSTYQYIASSCNAGNCTNSSQKTFNTQQIQLHPSPSPTIIPSPTPTLTPTPGSSGSQSLVGSCLDTDGGKDYFNKGRLVSDNENGDDNCETEKILREFLCNDIKTQGGSIRYSCPNGCSEGACIQSIASIDPKAAVALPPQTELNEKRIGFFETIQGEFKTDKAIFTYIQSFSSDFEGEIVLILPFEFKEYNSGQITIDPRPLLVSNDGTGKIRAKWEERKIKGENFEIKITALMAQNIAVLEQFKTAEMIPLNSKDAQIEPTAIAKKLNDTSGNSTKDQINVFTGLAATGKANSDDGNWFNVFMQLLLLIFGIGAINFFEKDLPEPGSEYTSSILEDLESENRRLKR